jgi:hypothetical protein
MMYHQVPSREEQDRLYVPVVPLSLLNRAWPKICMYVDKRRYK